MEGLEISRMQSAVIMANESNPGPSPGILELPHTDSLRFEYTAIWGRHLNLYANPNRGMIIR